MKWQQADAKSPRVIIRATQVAILENLKDIIQAVEQELPEQQGLTWNQIYYAIDKAKSKEPRIIFEDGEKET